MNKKLVIIEVDTTHYDDGTHLGIGFDDGKDGWRHGAVFPAGASVEEVVRRLRHLALSVERWAAK